MTLVVAAFLGGIEYHKAQLERDWRQSVVFEIRLERYFRYDARMSRRFQFSLRGLMMSVAMAAVIAWAAKLIGMGTAIGLLLVFPGLWVVSQRPLNGGIILLAVTMAGLCGGLIYDGYYSQLHAVDSVLAEFPEIDKVWLCTNDDVTLEVEGLWFSTIDQPQVVFGIEWGIDGASKSELRTRLRRVLSERQPMDLPPRATYWLR